jgi:hypothetical protein
MAREGRKTTNQSYNNGFFKKEEHMRFKDFCSQFSYKKYKNQDALKQRCMFLYSSDIFILYI